MPVEILDNNTGSTSIDFGTIKVSDLKKMTDDYRQNVNVSGTANSNPIKPKFSFYFTKLQLKDLIESNATADAIEITLAIQLPASNVSCNDINGPITVDTSNSMVAVLSCADKSSLEPFNNIGDMVLINGYKSNATGGGAQTDCCPNTKP